MLSDFRGKKELEQLGPPVDKAPFFVIPAKAGNQEELAVNDHLTGKNSTVPLHIVFLKGLSFVCFVLQEGLCWIPAFAGLTEKEVRGDLQAVQEDRNFYGILAFLRSLTRNPQLFFA